MSTSTLFPPPAATRRPPRPSSKSAMPAAGASARHAAARVATRARWAGLVAQSAAAAPSRADAAFAQYGLLGALHRAQGELAIGDDLRLALAGVDPVTRSILHAALQQAIVALDAAAAVLNENVDWAILEANAP